jgi:hypothetical protein
MRYDSTRRPATWSVSSVITREEWNTRTVAASRPAGVVPAIMREERNGVTATGAGIMAPFFLRPIIGSRAAHEMDMDLDPMIEGTSPTSGRDRRRRQAPIIDRTLRSPTWKTAASHA